MWLKVVVALVALAFVAYRGSVALEIFRARRRGDTARVEHLRTHGFGFFRFVLGTVVVIALLLLVFVVLEIR
jgi:hypothetical protein